MDMTKVLMRRLKVLFVVGLLAGSATVMADQHEFVKPDQGVVIPQARQAGDQKLLVERLEKLEHYLMKINEGDTVIARVAPIETEIDWLSRADINKDGKADVFDLVAMSPFDGATRAESNNWNIAYHADVNGDGAVNKLDFDIVGLAIKYDVRYQYALVPSYRVVDGRPVGLMEGDMLLKSITITTGNREYTYYPNWRVNVLEKKVIPGGDPQGGVLVEVREIKE